MKSLGVYLARADFAKCGFAEKKFSGVQWMFVKLQRPPPEIRIFFPILSARSRTATRQPRFPASIAHSNPAAPAPSTTTSNLLLIGAPIVSASLPRGHAFLLVITYRIRLCLLRLPLRRVFLA